MCKCVYTFRMNVMRVVFIMWKGNYFSLKLQLFLKSVSVSENVYMQTRSYFTHDAPNVMVLINASRPRDTFGTYFRLWSLLTCLAAEAGCQLQNKTRGLPGVLSGPGRILSSEVVGVAVYMKWQPNQCHCVSCLNPYNSPFHQLNKGVRIWIGWNTYFRNHSLKPLPVFAHINSD